MQPRPFATERHQFGEEGCALAFADRIHEAPIAPTPGTSEPSRIGVMRCRQRRNSEASSRSMKWLRGAAAQDGRPCAAGGGWLGAATAVVAKAYRQLVAQAFAAVVEQE